MSEAAAAALAAWRGGSVPAPGGGGGAGKTKKLSAQGNNLTKYWGAPLPSKKSCSKRFGGGVAAGRGGFELGGAGGDGGATPDRPPRVAGFRGGGAAASGTLEKVRTEQTLGVGSSIFITGCLVEDAVFFFLRRRLLVGYE